MLSCQRSQTTELRRDSTSFASVVAAVAAAAAEAVSAALAAVAVAEQRTLFASLRTVTTKHPVAAAGRASEE